MPEGFGKTPTIGPLEKVLKTPLNKITELPVYSLEGDVRYQELEQLLNQAPTGEPYRSKLNWYFTNHQQADVFRGYLLTRKGVLALLDNQYDEALNYFYQVVEGRVPARRLDVIKSAKRIAWILHQQGNRTRAWQAYKEIESFTASDLVRAQCLAERAGIVFELARGAGKANFSEVEHFCNCSLRNIPEEFTKQHALIMVIKTELLMTLREWHKALNICEQIISLYKNNPECRREYAITLCHSGWLNLWFNKITTAEQCFQRIYAEIPTIKESFAGYNFFAEANLGLAFIKNRLKERGTAIKMAEEIILKFPNTQTS